MVEYIALLDKSTDVSGTSTRVYDCGDIVIKVIEDACYYDFYVKIHEDLDSHGLLPPLIANFCYDDSYYLVIKKIECLDAKIKQKLGITTSRGYTYFEALSDEEDKYQDEIEAYSKEVVDFGYQVCDHHLGNYGFLNGKVICLDEDSFSQFDIDSIEFAMMNRSS